MASATLALVKLKMAFAKRLSQGYVAYIKSKEWAAKRQYYFSCKGKLCQACGSRSNIVVHHLSYANLGREPLTDLMGLCQDCHKEVHKIHRKLRGDLRSVTMVYVNTKRARRLPYNL